MVDEPVNHSRAGAEPGVAYAECDRKNVPTIYVKKEFYQKANPKMLTNILKHAQATEATIIISIIEGKTLSILIQDNGIGFSQKNSLGNGIRIMEKRMKEINGTFYIESTTNGTIITLKAIL